MATIRTAIELYDAFTAPMMNIVQAVSMGVSAMGDMQAAMNEPVSASIAESITEQMNQAVQAIEEAKAAAGVTEDIATWSEWKKLGFEVLHGSKALFGCDLIWGSKGDGQTYKARFFGKSQVQAVV